MTTPSDLASVRGANAIVENSTAGLLSLDGLLIFGTQFIVSQGSMGDKFVNAAGVTIAHQAVHNLIDNGSTDNPIKRFDRQTLPTFLPADGLSGGVAAYAINGYEGLGAFTVVHGAIHPMIVDKSLQ